MARTQFLSLLLSAASVVLFVQPGFAQKINDLPDLPTSVAGNPHPMPGPGSAIQLQAGNSNTSITHYANGVRQKQVGSATITKWPDGAVMVSQPGQPPQWKWDNPNVVGRASSNDGTRVTIYQKGTTYISQPAPGGGRQGTVYNKDGNPILNVPAPFAPAYTQNGGNPYLNAITGGNPYSTAAANHAPKSNGSDEGYDPLDPSVFSTLLSPIPYSNTVGAPLPPYEAGPLIDTLGTTINASPSPSTPSSTTACPDGM